MTDNYLKNERIAYGIACEIAQSAEKNALGLFFSSKWGEQVKREGVAFTLRVRWHKKGSAKITLDYLATEENDCHCCYEWLAPSNGRGGLSQPKRE